MVGSTLRWAGHETLTFRDQIERSSKDSLIDLELEWLDSSETDYADNRN
jgi:hypothetical protein